MPGDWSKDARLVAGVAPQGHARMSDAAEPLPAFIQSGKIAEPGRDSFSIMHPDWAGWSRDNPFQCSQRELKLVASYMSGETKKQAAIDGGYTGNNPSRYGREVMMRERVRQEITRQANKQARDITYDPAKVLHCLVMIAEANLVDGIMYTKNGVKPKLRDLSTMPPEVKYAIKSVKIGKNGTLTIELHDKIQALRMLGEFFNMWGSDRGRGAGPEKGEGGEALNEAIVFERRMDEIGEVIRDRIDRTITKFERERGNGAPKGVAEFEHRDNPSTLEHTVD